MMMIGAMDAIRSNMVSGERNIREASQHLNEALIHFGSPENMSTSHDSGILDHLAGYMLYLSTPQPLHSGLASIQAMSMVFAYQNDLV